MLLNFLGYPKTKIARYVLKNLLLNFLAIFFIIFLVVFGNQFVLIVQDSIELGIPIQELLPLVSFNMIRDIPIIWILSIFLSIIIAISRLYKSSEAVILNSIGLSDKDFFQFEFPVLSSIAGLFRSPHLYKALQEFASPAFYLQCQICQVHPELARYKKA